MSNENESLKQKWQELISLLSGQKEVDIRKIQEENEVAISDIIKKLGLTASIDPTEQLRICALVHEYIRRHNSYNIEIIGEKEQYGVMNIRTIDLNNAVVKNNGVCSSNSIEFQEIVSRLGVTAECVALVNKNTGVVHMANLVLLGEYYFYFDTTMDAELFKDNKSLELHYAALGSEEYESIYKPDSIIPLNLLEPPASIPENISTISIPQEIINKLVNNKNKAL